MAAPRLKIVVTSPGGFHNWEVVIMAANRPRQIRQTLLGTLSGCNMNFGTRPDAGVSASVTKPSRQRLKVKSTMVFPSENEEYTGQVFDPRQYQQEIAGANRVLKGFLDDMDANRVPIATLKEVRIAACTIGLYAGYPLDACNIETFLDSEEAGSSYRKTASILKGFVGEMNALIQARLKAAEAAEAHVPNPNIPTVTSRTVNEDDIPF